jgi:hypothetical protein
MSEIEVSERLIREAIKVLENSCYRPLRADELLEEGDEVCLGGCWVKTSRWRCVHPKQVLGYQYRRREK